MSHVHYTRILTAAPVTGLHKRHSVPHPFMWDLSLLHIHFEKINVKMKIKERAITA